MVSKTQRRLAVTSVTAALTCAVIGVGASAPLAHATSYDDDGWTVTEVGTRSLVPAGTMLDVTAPSAVFEKEPGEYTAWVAGRTRDIYSPDGGVVSVDKNRARSKVINGAGQVVIVSRQTLVNGPRSASAYVWDPTGSTKPVKTRIPISSPGAPSDIARVAAINDTGAVVYAYLLERLPTEGGRSPAEAAVRISPDGQTTPLIQSERGIGISDLSENGIAVGQHFSSGDVHGNYMVPFAGPQVPELQIPDLRSDINPPVDGQSCSVNRVSPTGTFVTLRCEYRSSSPGEPGQQPPASVSGVWSLQTGLKVRDLEVNDVSEVLDVDDSGRVLLSTESGPVLLDGTSTTALSALAGRNLIHPRFDAKNDIVAIEPGTDAGGTTWQAVTLSR